MTGWLIPMKHNKSVWKDEGTSWLNVFGTITGKIWKNDREKTEILRNSIKAFMINFYIWFKLNIDEYDQSELTLKWANISFEASFRDIIYSRLSTDGFVSEWDQR